MPRLPDATDLSTPIPRRQLALPQDQSSAILGRAVGSLVGSVQTATDQLHAQNVNMARAKAANALLDHEIAVKTTAEDIQQKIQNGELDYTKAGEAYGEAISKLQKPDIQNADPVTLQNFNRGVERLNFGGQQAVTKIVDTARRQDFKSQFEANLDKLGKLAGMPGANIDEINQKAAMFAPLAMSAGIPKDQVEQALQNFKDRNWLNDATQRAMEGKDSLPAIKQMEHDLTAADGYYAGKLDTDKRNAVLRSVINDRLVIENRLQHLHDKREALAQRALNQIDQQISSGVPATAEMWSNWAQTVKGTEAAADFQDRIDDEKEVQDTLRKPLADQLKFVQDKAAELAQGGTLRQHANLNRLTNAVKANVTQLQNAPLLFNENRTGQTIQPLQDLTDQGASKELTSRVATLTAMRKQYGNVVQMKPLLPQEAQEFSAALAKATPKEQADLFAKFRASINDTSAYMGAMQQIAPDSPVRALAGMLGAKQAQITTESHWFKPNDIATSGDVAVTMLQGEQILNQTKAQKAEDGKPKTALYLPNDSTLQSDFQNKVGTAFANRPGAAELAYQAVKSYYVGKAAQNGRLAASNSDIDGNLVKEAIDATLGEVVDYNGEGEVLAPWGMDKSTFDDRAKAVLATVVGEKSAATVGLRNAGENTYYVTQGKGFLTDKSGRPLVIDVTQPIPVQKRVSRGRGAITETVMEGWSP